MNNITLKVALLHGVKVWSLSYYFCIFLLHTKRIKYTLLFIKIAQQQFKLSSFRTTPSLYCFNEVENKGELNQKNPRLYFSSQNIIVYILFNCRSQIRFLVLYGCKPRWFLTDYIHSTYFTNWERNFFPSCERSRGWGWD